MSKPNVHGLPPNLRKDERGYFLDYFVQEGGVKRRKRVRLGKVPVAQAKMVLAQNMQRIIEHKYLGSEKPKATFLEAADSFLMYSESRKRSHQRDKVIVERLKAFFGNRSLESLNAGLAEAYLAERRKEGHRNHPDKSVKDGTLNRELACLKTIIRRAVNDRLIDWNPIQGVRRLKEQSRSRTLEAQEYQRLLDNCSDHVRTIVQLAYISAMRVGEILGLKWSQIDFQKRIIFLEAGETKTQESREVPLTEELVDIMRAVPRTLGSPFIFNWKGQGIKSIRTSFEKACGKAGISDFRFHDLRHCAVTNLRKAGVSDSVIMSISGHKTHAVFRKYDRVDRADRDLALKQAQRFNDTVMTRDLNTKEA